MTVPSLDPHVIACELADQIDRNLHRDLDTVLVGAETGEEIIRLVFRAKREATVGLLTQLIILLPDEDREHIVKLFKLRPSRC